VQHSQLDHQTTPSWRLKQHKLCKSQADMTKEPQQHQGCRNLLHNDDQHSAQAVFKLQKEAQPIGATDGINTTKSRKKVWV
jgi:hypothetical protein